MLLHPLKFRVLVMFRFGQVVWGCVFCVVFFGPIPWWLSLVGSRLELCLYGNGSFEESRLVVGIIGTSKECFEGPWDCY